MVAGILRLAKLLVGRFVLGETPDLLYLGL